MATGHKVLGALGMTGMPIVDVEAGCASGAAALMLGSNAIRAGQYDTVVVFGVEKMPRGIIRSSFFDSWQEEAGFAATPAYFALRAQRFMGASGVTKDHLAAVVVKNRRHGVHNPDAMYRSDVEADAVLRVAGGLRTAASLDAVLPQRGSGRRGAPTGGRRRRGGSGRAHRGGGGRAPVAPARCRAQRVDPDGRAGRRHSPHPDDAGGAGRLRSGRSGPRELDVVECQDTDAARELMSYEELGLCPTGGAAEMLEAGVSSVGGRLPVNPSGGLLSKGEPLGASALGQVVELVHQLRGEAGGRQVHGARVGLAHTVGRGANAGVVVLRRS